MNNQVNKFCDKVESKPIIIKLILAEIFIIAMFVILFKCHEIGNLHGK